MDKDTLKSLQKLASKRVITDEEFDDFLTDEVRREKKLANERDIEGVIPKLIVLAREKFGEKFTLVPCLFSEFPDKNKQEMFMGLGAQVYDGLHKEHLSVVAAYLVSEVWMKQVDKNSDEEKEINEGKRISEFEDKTEMFLITGMTIDLRSNQAMTRVSHLGKFIHLGRTEFMYAKDREKHQRESHNFMITSFFQGYKMAMMADQKAKEEGGVDN